MATLNFPNSGLFVGYEYIGPNGIKYTYDGTKWNGSDPDSGGGVVERTIVFPQGAVGDTRGTIALTPEGETYICVDNYEEPTENAFTVAHTTADIGQNLGNNQLTVDLRNYSDLLAFVLANEELVGDAQFSVDAGSTWIEPDSYTGMSWTFDPPYLGLQFTGTALTDGQLVILKFSSVIPSIWKRVVDLTVSDGDGEFNLTTPGDLTIEVIRPDDYEGDCDINLYAADDVWIEARGDEIGIRANSQVGITTGDGGYDWVFGDDGNLSLPQGSTIGETATTTVITPPGAAPGQSLVIRPTGVQGITSDHPGGFTDGDTITITVTPDYGGIPVTGTVDYTFTGCTQLQLGRALTGTLTFNNEGAKTITWTIPVSSTMTTFTITLSNASGFSLGGLISPLTLTTTGSNEDHHIHLVAGDPVTTDIYLGDDDQYVKIEKDGGDVVIGTSTNTNHWTFGTDGKLTLPNSGVIDVGLQLGTTPGLIRKIYSEYSGGYALPNPTYSELTALISSWTADTTDTVTPISWTTIPDQTWELTGYFRAPEAGTYTFNVSADDYYFIVIDDDIDPVPVINTSAVVVLTQGQVVSYKVLYANVAGNGTLDLQWKNTVSQISYTSDFGGLVTTDTRGTVDLTMVNSKWAFGTDGTLTLPNGGIINETQVEVVNISGGAISVLNQLYTKVDANTYLGSNDCRIFTEPLNPGFGGKWRLREGLSNDRYESTDLETWTVFVYGGIPQAGEPTPTGTLGVKTTTTNLTVNSNDWKFGINGNLTTPGDILPDADNVHNLGSPDRQWHHLYVSTGSIYLGNIKLSNEGGNLAVYNVNNAGDQNETQTIIKVVNSSPIENFAQDGGTASAVYDNLISFIECGGSARRGVRETYDGGDSSTTSNTVIINGGGA